MFKNAIYCMQNPAKIFWPKFALALALTTAFFSCATTSKNQTLNFSSKIFKKSETKETANKRLQRLIEKTDDNPLQKQELDEAFLIAETALFYQQIPLASGLYQKIFSTSPTLVVGLKLAKLHTLEGNLDAAEKVVRKLDLFYPSSVDPELALAFIQQVQGKKEQALLTLEKAYQRHPTHERVSASYVDALLEADKKSKASEILAVGIKNIPQSSYLQLKLAKLQVEEKKYQNAKATLDRLLRLDPDNPEAWTLAGFIALEEKRSEDAERFFREAYEKQPENIMLARFYVSQLLQREKYQEARRLLLRIEQASDEKSPFDPELMFQLAYTNFQLEDYAAAKSGFLGLVEKASDKGRLLFFAAQCDELNNQPLQALNTYSKIDKESEFFGDANQRIILINFEEGLIAETKKLLHHFEEYFADEERNYKFIASMNARLKDYQRAEQILTRALVKYPHSADLRYLKAAQSEFLVSKEESLKQLEAFLIEYPNHLQAMNHLGYSLAEQGKRLDFAESLLKRATKAQPKNGFFLDSLGWVYFKKGELSQAEKFLMRALQHEPQEPIILEHLAEVKLSSKDFHQALVYFNKARAILNAKPSWKLQYDEEWKASQMRVERRIKELENYALGKP